jgi:hypothetical protein
MKANPFTALIPTRRALNPPGPKANAMPVTSVNTTFWLSSIWDTAGINSEVWFTEEYQHRLAITRPVSGVGALYKATPAYLVEVSTARSIIS